MFRDLRDRCTLCTDRTKDDSGQEKVSCGCGGTRPGHPPGWQPARRGFFEAIASFFNRLFGGK